MCFFNRLSFLKKIEIFSSPTLISDFEIHMHRYNKEANKKKINVETHGQNVLKVIPSNPVHRDTINIMPKEPSGE